MIKGLFSLGLSLAFLPPIASAVRYNVTFDDTYGDPRTGNVISYAPEEAWTLGQRCTDCMAEPDAAQAHNGTWHDGSANDPSTSLDAAILMANVPFIGDAVYVYCILADSSESPDGYTSLRFYIDGKQVGEFVHNPSGDGAYRYNVPVYANSSIPFAGHLLQIINGAIGGPKSLILLDYVVYTFDTEAVVEPLPGDPESTLPPQTVPPTRSSVAFSSASLIQGATTASSAFFTSQLSSFAAPTSTVARQVPFVSSSAHPGTLSNVSLALVITFCGGFFVTVVIGTAVSKWQKRKRSRIAPSTEYLRGVAATQGGEAGAIVAGAGTSTSPTSRWTTAGDGPPTPVSIAPLEPLRPTSARGEASGSRFEGPFSDDNEAEIQQVSRT
ncbi:hypothetical protein BN946_scf184829.g16 [Trametes cinnabarina]|uniref:Uncharacterized protein n=1 Tax=Pycnoporus cinnabarinus TaxID=5643 RepID=A0A060SEU4_PYCCI|nr:hypothetical protein BN946_scf184829.g16 [Trametes cinnabarina]